MRSERKVRNGSKTDISEVAMSSHFMNKSIIGHHSTKEVCWQNGGGFRRSDATVDFNIYATGLNSNAMAHAKNGMVLTNGSQSQNVMREGASDRRSRP